MLGRIIITSMALYFDATGGKEALDGVYGPIDGQDEQGVAEGE